MTESFTSYRETVNRSLGRWPELAWLNRFLRTPKPADAEATSVQVFELLGDRLELSKTHDNAISLSQSFDTAAHNSRLQIVLVGHRESWEVDRDIVDIVCSKYDIDPRFVARHFDYFGIHWEERCPQDLQETLENGEDYFTR